MRSSEISLVLKQLREARHISIRQAAQEAGIAHTTLGRWEAGTCQPRMKELEAALAALGAQPSLRVRALALLPTPRAAAKLRAPPENPDRDCGLPPCAGDLARAMRRRAGWTQAALAKAIGVQTSTLCRWERSLAYPSLPHLDALCTALHAHEAERAVICAGLVRVQEADMDTLKRRVRTCLAQMAEGAQSADTPLMELTCLTLEAQLWPFAPDDQAAYLLLAEVYSHHAAYLFHQGRMAEAQQYAQRVLDIASDDLLACSRRVLAFCPANAPKSRTKQPAVSAPATNH